PYPSLSTYESAPVAPGLYRESCPLSWEATAPDTILSLIARAPVSGSPAERRALDASYMDAGGHNAVHWSVRMGARSATERVVSRGVPADLPDVDGATPLMVAAGRADTWHVQFLLRNGADPAATNAAGQTPLMYLAASCEPVPVSMPFLPAPEPALLHLVEAGVDLDAQDSRGRTALMHATRGSGRRVRDLLLAGADPYRVDRSGQSALDIAAAGPYSPDNAYIVALLEGAVAAGGWAGVPPEERRRYLADVDEGFNDVDHPWRAREIPPDSVFILPYRP
ncbi:MAG TPA: ankyrin repeat domain-containing protein, partial [Longimicrobium sp.]|nr:ankyrin repeat domain-containing protein [Longimicrobium sp.]